MSTWMYRKTIDCLSGQEINMDEYEGQRVDVRGTLKDGYLIDSGSEYLEVQSIKAMKIKL